MKGRFCTYERRGVVSYPRNVRRFVDQDLAQVITTRLNEENTCKVLVAAIGSLHAFVQSNWTGPRLDEHMNEIRPVTTIKATDSRLNRLFTSMNLRLLPQNPRRRNSKQHRKNRRPHQVLLCVFETRLSSPRMTSCLH